MTSKAGNTAGPWSVERPNRKQSPNLWIAAPSSAGICKIEPCDYDDGRGERLTAEDYANAHLIASAPDMLDALKKALTTLQFLAPHNRYPDGTVVPGDSELIREIKAALAKAGGA